MTLKPAGASSSLPGFSQGCVVVLGRLEQLYDSLGPGDIAQIGLLAVVLLGAWRLLGKTCGSGSFIGRGLALVLIGLFLIVQVVLADLDLNELATILDY